MRTTDREKQLLRETFSKIVTNDTNWLQEKCFVVGNKPGHWIINYNSKCSGDNKNEYNRLTRGMVIRKADPDFQGDFLSLIASFPMIRFFNQHEPQADAIDYSNAEMLEKMDGTFVGVYFPNGHQQPEFHTRQMMSTQEENATIKTFYGQKVDFLQLIRSYVDTLTLAESDVGHTYCFELIDDATRVVTKYTPEQYGLYLIAVRNLNDHRELSEDELDALAVKIKARRPRRWQAVEDRDLILAMFDEAAKTTPDFEGFIFRDKITGKRIKVKDPRYVEKHHLLGRLRFRVLIPLILKGEAEEILAYFPQAKELIDAFQSKFDSYNEKAVSTVLEWKAKNIPRKELSKVLYGENTLKKWEQRLRQIRKEKTEAPKKALDDDFLLGLIMRHSHLDEAAITERVYSELLELGVGQGTNLGNPQRLAEVIGLGMELENEYEDDLEDA